MYIRCKDSRYIDSAFLEGYKLSFCAASRDYGVANIVKKKGSKVPVALTVHSGSFGIFDE
jgi:hypothetical protein